LAKIVIVTLTPGGGANPTHLSYNATSSLLRFEIKNIFFYFKKRLSRLKRWRCSCKFQSRRIGPWSECRDIFCAETAHGVSAKNRKGLVEPTERLAVMVTNPNATVGGGMSKSCSVIFMLLGSSEQNTQFCVCHLRHLIVKRFK
jgi:hypothetical protein